MGIKGKSNGPERGIEMITPNRPRDIYLNFCCNCLYLNILWYSYLHESSCELSNCKQGRTSCCTIHTHEVCHLKKEQKIYFIMTPQYPPQKKFKLKEKISCHNSLIYQPCKGVFCAGHFLLSRNDCF